MKAKKKRQIVFSIGVVCVLAFLFAYPKIWGTDANIDTIAGDVPCLNSNLSLDQHIHPELRIFVDGVQEPLPKGIGLDLCEKAVHTHDEDNVIHIEAQDRRAYTLGDFFHVWKKTISREGYSYNVTDDGEEVSDFENLPFRDGQKIEIHYTKNSS